nr:MAG TPA: hypothetical protein [Caudoviricetes sp.]
MMEIKVRRNTYWLDYEEYEKFKCWWKRREQEFPKCSRTLAND